MKSSELMMFFKSGKIWIIGVLICSPFLEGGDSAKGLLLAHTLCLISLVSVLFYLKSCRQKPVVPDLLRYAFPFFALYFLSVFFSAYKYSSFLSALKVLLSLLLFFAVYNSTIRTGELIKAICVSAVIQLSVVAINGISAYILNLEAYCAKGTFLHQGHLAVYLLMVLALILGKYLSESKKTIHPVLFCIASALLVAGAFLTNSRVVPLCTLLLVALVLLNFSKIKKSVISAVLVAGLSLSIVFVANYKSEDVFRFNRIKIWEASVSTVLEKPWLGWGPGNFSFGAMKHNFPNNSEIGRYGKIISSAESGYLELAAQCGIPALVMFLFAVALFFRKYFRDKGFSWVMFPLVIFLFSALFHSLFKSTALLFLTVSIIATGMKGKRENNLTVSLPEAIPTALFIFVFYAGAVIFPYAGFFYSEKMTKATTTKDILENYNNAVAYVPFQPYYPFRLAKLVVRKGDISLKTYYYAHKLLDRSLELNPLEPDFFLEKARLLILFSEKYGSSTTLTEEVDNLYEEALQKNPFNVFIYYERAVFCRQTFRSDEAEKYLDEAIKLEPAFLRARLRKVLLKCEKEDFTEAEKEFSMFEEIRKKLKKKKVKSDYERALIDYERIFYEELKDILRKKTFSGKEKL